MRSSHDPSAACVRAAAIHAAMARHAAAARHASPLRALAACTPTHSSPGALPPGRFAEQVAVVTGAASGIGRAVCQALAAQAARLVMIDRNGDSLADCCRELSAPCDRLVPATVDVTDREALAAAIERAAAVLGPPELLIASAGITGVTLVDDLNVGRAEAIARVNFLGVVYAIDAVLPAMLQRGRGQIAVVSSLAGCRGIPFSAAYSASKAAVSNYLESIRPALRKRGIYVTTLYPGFVRTPLMENAELQPALAMLEPAHAAQYILYALRRRKRTYGFPWTTNLAVRCLRWLSPAVYDWLMARAAAKIPNLKY